MAWYAVFEVGTGELVSSGSVIDVDRLPPGVDYKTLPEHPGQEVVWDPDSLAFVRQKVPPAPISRQEFLGRFSVAERLSVIKSENADVRAWLELLKLSDTMAVDGDEVQEGLALLVAEGVLSQPRADEIQEA